MLQKGWLQGKRKVANTMCGSSPSGRGDFPAPGPAPGGQAALGENLKRYTHPSVHSSTIHNSQDTETT